MPVIYFQNGWDSDYVEAGGPGSPNWHKSNALKTMRARPELQGKLLAKGGWDYELVDELKPVPGDIVLHKTRYSGFFNSQLDSVLRSRGVRHLVFVGIATNVCVESTLRDGFFLEYFGTVLEDATHQAGPEFVQKAALYNIETFFGWVSTTADFKGRWGSGKLRERDAKSVVIPRLAEAVRDPGDWAGALRFIWSRTSASRFPG